jgi:hypothetical protein
VELYAKYEPNRLLDFLRISTSYPLEEALRICEERQLIREQVFIRGRLGDTKGALQLILSELKDMKMVCTLL